jgi:hypothetical protein
VRKLVVCNIMSLDGYVAGPGGNVMVLPLDPAFDAYNLERLRAADTLLLGQTHLRRLQGLLAVRGGRPQLLAHAPGELAAR